MDRVIFRILGGENNTRMSVNVDNGDDVRTNGNTDNVRSGNENDGRVGTPTMR